jgi:dUTP pyrophosphatase
MDIKVIYSDRAFPLDRGTSGSAGWDIKASECCVLQPNKVMIIDTGIRLEIPGGYEVQVRSRSGIALDGVMIANGIGTIDSDYRGFIKVLMTSLNRFYTINRGDRIAQLVIQKVENANFLTVDTLSDTQRGAGGFGSTGK